MPYTQVRLDPIRGRVTEARGRWLFGFREIETTHHMVSSFSHVRILERSRSGDDGPEDVFPLLLEGPIEWAGDDGDVHLRPDAVALREFRSLEVARVHAAQVASVLGLRVLQAGG